MMAECRGGGGDCLIKLFGKTIPVPESGDAKDLEQSGSISSTDQDQDAPENAQQDTSDPSPQPEVVDAEDPKTSPEARQKSGDGDAASSQREKLKKPDKVLPCPRCKSMDTKFCYFNNYNINQPRHFCKNCQRYWTAGGAMRNVPVGAGRRKNKNAVAASHFLQRVRAALPACGDPLKANGGTVLSFGRATAPTACLDLAEQLSHLAPVRTAGNPGPCSEGSSNRDDKTHASAGAGAGAGAEPAANRDGAQHPPASVNVWPYSGCAPSPAPAAYFSSGIAIPIYPAAPGYWGCMVPGAWSMPWPVQPLSSSSPTSVASSGADSHALGKHPRDRDGEDGRNGGHGSAKVWAPKTIRIDDVDEVARSSIWSLVGIKGGDKKQQQEADHHHAGGQKKVGMVFEPKCEAAAKAAKQAMMASSPLLHANPVALTRSVAFQEGS